MIEKEISLDSTLYDVTERYPELIDVLFNLGFMGVKNQVMRESHGRQMTLRAGCGHLNIELPQLISVLREKGFAVKD